MLFQITGVLRQFRKRLFRRRNLENDSQSRVSFVVIAHIVVIHHGYTTALLHELILICHHTISKEYVR